MANDVVLNLLADTTDATKSIEKFGKSSSKSLESIEKAFGGLKTVAIAAVGILAGREIVRGINEAVRAAAAEEDAINALNTSLQLAGKFTTDASKNFQSFAQTIERSTKFSSEAVLENAALIESLGRLDEQGLQQATKAALDLSAALRIDLQSAATLVGKAANGEVGTFKRYGITITEGKNAAETFANALAKINSQFGGAAAAQVNTFSGAVEQLNVAAEDLQKLFGGLIVNNPVVVAGIKAITESLRTFTDAIQVNEEGVKGLIGDLIIFVSELVPQIIKGVGIIYSIFVTLNQIILKTIENVSFLIAAFLDLDAVKAVSKALADSFKTLGVAGVKSLEGILTILSKIPGFGDKVEGALASVSLFAEDLQRSIGEDITFDKPIKKLEILGFSAKRAAEESEKDFLSFNKALLATSDVAQNVVEKLKAARSGSVGKAPVLGPTGPIDDGFGGGTTKEAEKKGKAEGEAKSKAEEKGAVKQEKSLYDTILSAFNTAGSVLSGIFQGGFINSLSGFIKSIGDIPGLILDAFKNLNATVNNLLESLPKIIDELLAALPGLVAQFAKSFPKLVSTLLDALPAIVDKLSSGLSSVVQTIVSQLPRIIEALPAIIDRTLQELPKIIDIILKGLPRIITAIAKALPQIVRSLAAAIPEIVVVLANNMAPIILALVQGILEAIPSIVIALVDEFLVKGGIFKIIGALIQAMPQIAVALVQGVVRAAFNSSGELFKYLGKIFSGAIKFPAVKFNAPDMEKLRGILSGQALFDKLKNILGNPPFLQKLQKILDSFNPGKAFGGGGGGIGGALGGVGKKLGFAEGGLVPKGFPNDAFPARLTSGELVIPPGDTGRLSAFLDRQEGGGSVSRGEIDRLIAAFERSSQKNLSVNIQVGERDLANVILNLNRQGFRTA